MSDRMKCVGCSRHKYTGHRDSLHDGLWYCEDCWREFTGFLRCCNQCRVYKSSGRVRQSDRYWYCNQCCEPVLSSAASQSRDEADRLDETRLDAQLFDLPPTRLAPALQASQSSASPPCPPPPLSLLSHGIPTAGWLSSTEQAASANGHLERAASSDANGTSTVLATKHDNPGSVGHPEMCGRLCIYHLNGSCTNGSSCTFCHCEHVLKRERHLDKRNRELLKQASSTQVLAVTMTILREKLKLFDLGRHTEAILAKVEGLAMELCPDGSDEIDDQDSLQKSRTVMRALRKVWSVRSCMNSLRRHADERLHDSIELLAAQIREAWSELAETTAATA
eukprot:TRINITY_DN14077_c0_g2_i1.p1 TRINITY_DN14077_c0_g2~~TRINITY_DN14077_c0_g2_i1.p1  ORF type:complete len:336 (-),score=22.45 TRINITY_DN14077_c0_g2_i1:381-1388(-)